MEEIPRNCSSDLRRLCIKKKKNFILLRLDSIRGHRSAHDLYSAVLHPISNPARPVCALCVNNSSCHVTKRLCRYRSGSETHLEASRSESMRYVKSQASTTSFGVDIAEQPSCPATNADRFPSLRFHTTTLAPALARLDAIPWPMIPAAVNIGGRKQKRQLFVTSYPIQNRHDRTQCLLLSSAW